MTQMKKRIDREIEEKEGLLVDLEEPVDLKLMPLTHHKRVLVNVRDYSVRYTDAEKSGFYRPDLPDRTGRPGRPAWGKRLRQIHADQKDSGKGRRRGAAARSGNGHL